MKYRRLVSFDWALKKLLRSKANFDILEGFLSELLKEDISILEVLESESNKEDRKDKYNRVDLKVKDSKDEIILIEIQYERELDFLLRILYGISKTIVEHMKESDPYAKVLKVISVNILYFNLGQGQDYVYKGSTAFIGIHNHDELKLTKKQKKLFKKESVSALYPEYYLIKVNQFNDVAKDSLDQWIYFLKNEEIKDDFSAKGLLEAKEKLDVLKLSDNERQAYEYYTDDLHYQASMYESSYGSGYFDGEEKGRKQGKEEGRKQGIEEGREQGKLIGEMIGKILLVQEMKNKGNYKREDLENLSIDELRAIFKQLAK